MALDNNVRSMSTMTKSEKAAVTMVPEMYNAVSDPVTATNPVTTTQTSVSSLLDKLDVPVVPGTKVSLMHLLLLGAGAGAIYMSIPQRKRKNLFK